MVILQVGFEDSVRTKLGVDDSELTDAEINQPVIATLAEQIIIKRVPDYATISDPVEKLFLENAVICQIGQILCPTMARRVEIEVGTMEAKWKKDKVNWMSVSESLAGEVESSLGQISSVTVEMVGSNQTLFTVANSGRTITQTTGG